MKKYLPKAQEGLSSTDQPANKGWFSSIEKDLKSLFGIEDKPQQRKQVVLTMPQNIQIKDNRKKSLTTGKALDPNVELLTGSYPSERIYNIVRVAKQYGVDPYTALAIDLQETGWGKKSDAQVGHVINEPGVPTLMQTADDIGAPEQYDKFIRAIMDKQNYAKKLGITDPYTVLQTYNGLGKIFPSTEKKYHGFEMAKVYGVPLPKEGIDMRQNPLYGRRVTDIRDNILKQNKDLEYWLRYIKKSGGPIVDPRGQWAHPGKDTIIPTHDGKITMQNVPYPVYGQDETGYSQMMYPDRKYQFPGQMVYEKPIMQLGGVKDVRYVDSIHNANMNKDFVKRLFDNSYGSIPTPKDVEGWRPGQRSTHLMAFDPGSRRVYPEVVNINGKLTYMPGDKAWNYADSTGEYIEFPTAADAEWYASSINNKSGYKMGTNVLGNINSKTGKPEIIRHQMGGFLPRFQYAGEADGGGRNAGCGITRYNAALDKAAAKEDKRTDKLAMQAWQQDQKEIAAQQKADYENYINPDFDSYGNKMNRASRKQFTADFQAFMSTNPQMFIQDETKLSPEQRYAIANRMLRASKTAATVPGVAYGSRFNKKYNIDPTKVNLNDIMGNINTMGWGPYLEWWKKGGPEIQKNGGSTYSGGVWYQNGGTLINDKNTNTMKSINPMYNYPVFAYGGSLPFYQEAGPVWHPEWAADPELAAQYGYDQPAQEYIESDIPGGGERPLPPELRGKSASQKIAYKGPSVVEMLNSVGKASDYASRKKLAASLNMTNYRGTAEQNIALMHAIANNPEIIESVKGAVVSGSNRSVNQSASKKVGVPVNRNLPNKKGSVAKTQQVAPNVNFWEQSNNAFRAAHPEITDEQYAAMQSPKQAYFSASTKPMAPRTPEQLKAEQASFDKFWSNYDANRIHNDILKNGPMVDRTNQRMFNEAMLNFFTKEAPLALATGVGGKLLSGLSWGTRYLPYGLAEIPEVVNASRHASRALPYATRALPYKQGGSYSTKKVGQVLNVTPEQAEILRQQGYEFDII